jgi:class 3 adenylate cyclase
VNLASRLCSEAAHGEILVDPRTIELIGEEARQGHQLAPGELLRLKGFVQPVQSYTLVAA